ncbi:cysteine--tRNA ligase [Tropheryma whipplei]|uniref:Cysteine--tRNA ligase 1 n=2 Tax=Tropheryma whipplei TaxID=2039 RepID=SYC1_TROWT|nr:cysteine--tRNA ligase [Tropheryma whipplei]Q83GF1.1 RecName: Full=Cysteine--tRNA ligase 1; AltName: Full=Cysteinyl-tRNA synthetase 1; Short=CysRS 1 [Tropheryma whipplei str. Twist]Q83HS8.1 RecName: Full=Cysteine--tRNA ligase 1; AltName: Full=Cysteinyl-tRNA synthetase 1; Short=CysRS 1 [Tropheryma whipplei TW08/27]AAO44444.1 cysteinyl-tRNA synthetase [Tropheryma whipplei str. Twist]MCO8182392.1 cysteine--tRNA ligase [Tropheryma whipplei]CAD67093.1 cysteinyl-tRNA synthetase [Tropheryma whipple
MTLNLYDTLSRRIVTLDCRDRVELYVCGPTVQSPPHIGHMRSGVVYDCLRRWLEYKGLPVLYVRNITDIDDKILASARSTETGETWWQIAYRVSGLFNEAYKALFVKPPDYEPLVTAHIPDIIKAIEILIQKNVAYRAMDGSGNVFFSIDKHPSYGELTDQKDLLIDDCITPGKRDPRDFTLWKEKKDTDPDLAFWESPWGPGRPGWHIECSVMATKYLGTRFAIHGGGVDLRFPHHENELAQARALGAHFADIWMHTGAVNVEGIKMSKSFGNSVLVQDALSKVSPSALRYYFLTAHYRSTLNYTENSLSQACNTWNKLQGCIYRVYDYLEREGYENDFCVSQLNTDFSTSLDNDLNIPEALAIVHNKVREMNRLVDTQADMQYLGNTLSEVVEMLSILCPIDHKITYTSGAQDNSKALLQVLLEARDRARSKGDFYTSDLLRELLAEADISVSDGHVSYGSPRG